MQQSLHDNKNISSASAKQSAPVLLIVGILCIAANLRAPLTSVGPLVGFIRDSLHLSGTVAGMITTLPLFAFALFSPLVPGMARKFGAEAVLLCAAGLLTAGIVLRSWLGDVGLFLGTAALGLSISAGNVLLPSLIKRNFPQNFGIMIGVYSISMNGFAAVASGISIPLASAAGLGWTGSLQVWALLGAASFVLWIPQISGSLRRASALKDKSAAGGSSETLPAAQPPQRTPLLQAAPQKPSRQRAPRKRINLWKSALAWEVTIYMGLQSMVFYCMVAWLPAILVEGGASADQAGWMLSLMQMTLLPATFIISIVAGRKANQQKLVLVGSACAIVGLAGILLMRDSGAVFIWIAVLGVGGGCTFGLAMLFFVMRTNTADETAALSGMAQSGGYLLAALGPILFGYLHDVTNDWTISLVALIGMAVICLISGLGASRDTCVNAGSLEGTPALVPPCEEAPAGGSS